MGCVDEGNRRGMERGVGVVGYRGVGGWRRRVSKAGGCDASEIRS